MAISWYFMECKTYQLLGHRKFANINKTSHITCTLHRNRNIIIITLKLLFKIFCNSVFVHFSFPGCLNISKSFYSKGKTKILKSMSAEEAFGPKTEQGTENGENNTISSFKIYVFFKQPVLKSRNKR